VSGGLGVDVGAVHVIGQQRRHGDQLRRPTHTHQHNTERGEG
jgi:hypothetical protein